MSILKILALANVGLFLLFMLFWRQDKNRLYIQYVLLAYPLMSLFVLPLFNGFDSISILFLLIFYRPRRVHLSNGLVYQFLFWGLLAVVTTGLIQYGLLGEENIYQLIALSSIFIFAKVLIDECLLDPYFFYEVLRCLKITLVVSFLFLACQFVFGIEFALIKTYNPNIVLSDAIRYPSFLSDPQTYSQFLAALSFICLIRDPRDEKFHKLNYVFVLLALLAILSAGGRAGLLGWAAGMVIVVFFGNASYRIAIIISIIALYFIAINFQDSFAIFKRSGDMNETYEFRHAIWMDALSIFEKYPFFGIGLANYADYVSRHHPDQVWVVDNEFVFFDHPESGYLKFLTELGALGFICIFGLILIPMIRSFIYFLISRDTSLILLIAAILSWMVGFYSTYSMGDVRIKIMVVTLVCLLITSRQRLEFLYDTANASGQEEENLTEEPNPQPQAIPA